MLASKLGSQICNGCIDDNQMKAIEHLPRLLQVIRILESCQNPRRG